VPHVFCAAILSRYPTETLTEALRQDRVDMTGSDSLVQSGIENCGCWPMYYVAFFFMSSRALFLYSFYFPLQAVFQILYTFLVFLLFLPIVGYHLLKPYSFDRS
jgi:hypothetical protein